MQRCTTFSLASVADLLAKGEFDEHKVVGYDDIYGKYEQFLDNLTKLGLYIDDSQRTDTEL